jgi:hypothetical protein
VSVGETTTRYMCVAREHVNGDGLSHGHFTVWQGTWGYCPSQRPGDGHEWQAISDVLHGSPEEISHRIRHYLQTHLAGEAVKVVESVQAR